MGQRRGGKSGHSRTSLRSHGAAAGADGAGQSGGGGRRGWMRTVWVVAAIGVGICAIMWQSGWLIRGRSGAHYTSEDEARRYKAAKSVLMHSAVSGDRASLHKAITAVPSVVNAQNERDHTAVTVALEARHHYVLQAVTTGKLGRPYEEIIRMLLSHPEYRAEINCPSYYAVQYRNLPALEMLSAPRHVAALLTCMDEADAFNETMLHIAARSKAAGFARVFVALASTDEWKSDVTKNPMLPLLGIDPPRNLSLTAMAAAISAKDLELLLRHATSAMVNRAGYDGNTPLHVAALSGNRAGVAALIGAGAAIDAQNDRGETPLHMAAGSGLIATVATLLRLDADPELLDSSGASYHDVMPTATVHGEEHVTPYLPSEAAQPRDISGGWGSVSRGTDASCDIPSFQLDDLSEERFWDEFVLQRRPVRVIGATWPATKRWARDQFLERYGGLQVDVAPVPYASLYSGEKAWQSSQTPIAEFVNGWMSENRSSALPQYVFDSKVLWKNPALGDDLPLPWLDDANIILKQFILGPVGSGAYPHFHNAALNALVHGRKKWYIFPPGSAFFHVEHVGTWTATHLARLQADAATGQGIMFECTQQAGELMFVPDLWGHAVVNEEDSIAVAYEFHP